MRAKEATGNRSYGGVSQDYPTDKRKCDSFLLSVRYQFNVLTKRGKFITSYLFYILVRVW